MATAPQDARVAGDQQAGLLALTSAAPQTWLSSFTHLHCRGRFGAARVLRVDDPKDAGAAQALLLNLFGRLDVGQLDKGAVPGAGRLGAAEGLGGEGDTELLEGGGQGALGLGPVEEERPLLQRQRLRAQSGCRCSSSSSSMS